MLNKFYEFFRPYALKESNLDSIIQCIDYLNSYEAFKGPLEEYFKMLDLEEKNEHLKESKDQII